VILFISIEPTPEFSEEEQVVAEENPRCFQDHSATVADWEYHPNKPKQIVRDPEVHLDPKKCSTITNMPPTMSRQQPSFGSVCDGFDGVLHISQGDAGGASGTIFFQFMVGMLQWADQFNYMPFVHLNNFSAKVYDTQVHGQDPGRSFTMMGGMQIGNALDARDPGRCVFPGRPELKASSGLRPEKFTLNGTGVWQHYFEPISPFDPGGDPSCEALPLVTMTREHIVFGIHSQAPWAPHPWRYLMPEYILQSKIPLQDWLMEQRHHAIRTTRRYIRFTPHMEQLAACAHPRPRNSLGMHIRHADKELSRWSIPVSMFLGFAQAFVSAEDGDIFVATDSGLVLEEILQTWPSEVRERVVYQPGVQGLSRNETAAFDLGVSVHRTNTEALTDLLALSKCTYLLHGLSALSEAVFYLNPGLMERAINLEDFETRYAVDYFVDTILPRGKNVTT